MRIGVNCFLLGPHIGGLKQYFHSLFNYLLQHDQENSFVFFYFDHNISELDELKSEHWRETSIRLQDQMEVFNYLDTFDLYFCPFGCLWPMPIPKPSVVTLVDIQEEFFPEFFTASDLRSRKYHFYGSTHMADRVITISQFSKQSIVRFHCIAAEKIDVVYLCADERTTSAAIEEKVAADFTLPERYIFYPANHWKHKNHDCLLRALQLLRDQDQLKIKAIFTGYDQPNGYPLNEKIDEYGLIDQVSNVGYLSEEQMAYLYRHAFLLCFPSHFEGFGIPLVEAMALGCPVICANTSSIPEVVGDAALLFDPNDPKQCAATIKRLWFGEDERKQLICKGYVQAQKFSNEKLAIGHLETFKHAQSDFRRSYYFWRKFIFHPSHIARCGLSRLRTSLFG
jgi:glycosyltransferase involved in cell wall biosynthesis